MGDHFRKLRGAEQAARLPPLCQLRRECISEDCVTLAHQLLESPNLKETYEANAAAAQQLQNALAAQATQDGEMENLQLLLKEKSESLSRVERALDRYIRLPIPLLPCYTLRCAINRSTPWSPVTLQDQGRLTGGARQQSNDFA